MVVSGDGWQFVLSVPCRRRLLSLTRIPAQRSGSPAGCLCPRNSTRLHRPCRSVAAGPKLEIRTQARFARFDGIGTFGVTRRTGTSLARTTAVATLPNMVRAIPPAPRVVIAIKSMRSCQMAPTITMAGSRASTTRASAVTPRSRTRKSFDVDFCTVARWDQNSQIIEENLFYDLVSFMKQIGVGS
jgi:hypothetical protein